MNSMNFTDWQDLSLKKDVERISKNIKPFPEINLSVIASLIIATLTLVLTAISLVSDKKIPIGLIVALAILSIIVPITIILVSLIMKYCKAIYRIKNNKMPTKEYVDKFDNKICSSAMMADSLFEHMKAEPDIAAKYYCISEINYYINKCIHELYAMKNMNSQVFVDDKINCVSPKRLRLVLKLLNNLRVQTYEEMNKITEKDLVVQEYVDKEIKKHDELITRFINNFNAIYGSQILSEWINVI